MLIICSHKYGRLQRLKSSVAVFSENEHLAPTIKKIYDALLPGGIFAGTTLYSDEPNDGLDFKKMGEVGAMNAYAYKKLFVVNILSEAQFMLEASSLELLSCPDSTHSVYKWNFIARK